MRILITILLILLSTAVTAQTTDISISINELTSEQPNTKIGNQYPPVYAYQFGTPTIVNEVNVTIDRYQCGCPVAPRGGQCPWYFGSPIPCGSLQLCISFDQDPQQFCQPFQDMTHIGQNTRQTLQYTFGNKLARNIKFIIQGISTSQEAHDAIIKSFTYAGGAATQFNRNIYTFRSDGPVELGRVRELIDITGAQANAIISSSDGRVAAWFSPQGGNAPTDTVETGVYDDYVYACLNLDQNVNNFNEPVCDYEDEEICAQQDKDWYDGYCCGDAPYTACQWYGDKQAFCGENNQGVRVWAALADKGLISTLDACPGIQVVSDGTTFHTCTDPPQGVYIGPNQKITNSVIIEGHEYRCENNEIIECGGDTPFNTNAKTTGDTATISNQVHYCTAVGTWQTSLDNDENGCRAAGLAWTGTKCCGETDDPLINYEDQTGGCYNNQHTKSGEYFGDQTIINYQGSYYICEPTRTTGTQGPTASPVFAGTGITPTGHGPCGIPLPNAKTTGTLKHLVCTPQGEWQFVAETDPYLLKSTKWQTPAPQQQGCCPDNQCWDGNSCKDIGEYYITGGTGYLCQ